MSAVCNFFDTWWGLYWIGVAIYGTALVTKLDAIDIASSYIAGLLWPVILPAHLLKRLMR